MVVSTIVSAIAFTTVVVVAVIVAHQTTKYNNESDQRLRNVVDQVNTSQQYGYEFDKRQQQDMVGLKKNIDDVRAKYLSKADAAQSFDTQQLNATSASLSNVTIAGSTLYKSNVSGASASTLYNIQRGMTDKSKNHLVFQTPIEPGAGFDFTNSGGISRMSIDSTTGVVKIPQRLEVNNRMTIGEQVYLSENQGALYVDTPNGIVANDFKVKGDFTVSGDILANGALNVKGSILAPSIGTGDNTLFGLNALNSNNPSHPGVGVYQGLSVNGGGGLGVGTWNKQPEGQAYIRDSLKVGHTDKLDGATISAWTPADKIGASFGGPDNWSHLPFKDGNTYIRPGVNGGAVFLGDSNTGSVNIGAQGTNVVIKPNTQFTPTHTFIRPGADGMNVVIGDMNTKEVHIGNATGSVYTDAPVHYVKQYVDATDEWGTSGKTLFAGWNSDKTVIGNNQTSASDFAGSLPKNSVISANNLYVYGETYATSNLCVNTTCFNETEIKKLKNFITASNL